MRVLPVHVLEDNYAYVLADESRRTAAVVDPGDAAPIRDLLVRAGLRLDAILATHHHADHVGAVADLCEAFPGIPVLGADADRGRLPQQTLFLRDGDVVDVAGARGIAIATPGHTRGGVAYHFPAATGGDLFAGDVLFGGTMGNLFEETPATMLDTLRKLRDLPAGTRMWPGHEYTVAGVRDAMRLQPASDLLKRRLEAEEATIRRVGRTVPLSLDVERRTNPFLRWDDPEVRALLGTDGDLATFRRLCEVL